MLFKQPGNDGQHIRTRTAKADIVVQRESSDEAGTVPHTAPDRKLSLAGLTRGFRAARVVLPVSMTF